MSCSADSKYTYSAGEGLADSKYAYPAGTVPNPCPYPYAYGAPPPPGHAAPPPYYPNGVPGDPVPPPPPPPYGDASSSRSGSLLRCFFTIALSTFLLLCLLSLVRHHLIRPHAPKFTVSSATVSGFNLSAADQLLSATFDLTLIFNNPSVEVVIDYGQLDVAILYYGDVISYALIPAFHQEKGNTTTIQAHMTATSAYLSKDAAEGMDWDRRNKDGAVRFRLKGYTSAQFTSDRWWTRWFPMRVVCEDVLIRLSNGMAATGALVKPNSCWVIL
ncbi:hypothetical protein Cni_G21502 [Canna indica]|uniref:Late embryogenesis abundant protein LEA-2 subgroup domain-containing protein n=1 Tax=Canna indica TaxID=4628 RepID=A0AAQ3QLQ8_9LILI|nr:hypothetical protein Cni_G21502 [Canna indica]